MAFGGISFDDIPSILPKGSYLFEITGNGEFTPNDQEHLEYMPNIGEKTNLTLKCEVSEDNEDPAFCGMPANDIFLATYPETKPLQELNKDERRVIIESMNLYRKVLVSLGVENSNAAISSAEMSDFHGVKFLAKVYVSENKETKVQSSYIDLKTIRLAASVSNEESEMLDFE